MKSGKCIPLGKLKKGTKVTVSFEGTITNKPIALSLSEGEIPVRISVKPKPGKSAWWAVVPLSAVTIKEEKEKRRFTYDGYGEPGPYPPCPVCNCTSDPIMPGGYQCWGCY